MGRDADAASQQYTTCENMYSQREVVVRRKLTITLDERVYEGLHRVVGRRRISRFLESLIRPHVIREDLEAAYRQMAQDEAREADAFQWAEATLAEGGKL
jgi:predicted CopG family antitoxin